MKNLSGKSVQPLESPTAQSEVAYQIAMALSNINGHYQKEIHSYSQELQEYILEIEKLKNQIKLLENNLAPQEKICENLKHDVNYELRLLERLNVIFIQDAKLLSELKDFLGTKKHSERFLEKQNALQQQLFEINDTEKRLLKKELEKQNVLIELKPIIKQIEMLHYKLKEIELEKHFLETTKIHQISQQELMNSNHNELEPNNQKKIIDTDIT